MAPLVFELGQELSPLTETTGPIIFASSIPGEGGFSLATLQSPPTWVVYIPFVISIVALSFSVYQFFVSRSDRKRDRDRLRDDDFWFRKIIVPICLDPLIRFMSEQSLKLRSIKEAPLSPAGEKQEYPQFLQAFKRGKNEIVSQCLILELFDGKLYEAIAEKLDGLEDYITLHCYHNSDGADTVGEQHQRHSDPHGEMASTLKSILAVMISCHKELFS